jgi:hypothetical protein
MSRALSSLNEQHESTHKHEISNWKTEMALLERKSEEYRTRAAALQVCEANVDKAQFVPWFSRLYRKSMQSEN